MVKIANASLLSDLELQREQELAEARAIQIGMLPQGALRTADAAICYSFHPFHEVGGDFLDFFTLTDGAIGIYLGDVAGKGLPAALYTALAVGTLRGVHKTGTPPSSVLSLLNRRVTLRGVTPRYAAVQYACLDPRTGILRIASAGDDGARAAVGTGKSGAGSSWHPTRNVSRNRIRQRDGAIAMRRLGNFSERWILRGAEFRGRILSVLEVCENSRENSPEEILQQLTEAVVSYSCGRPQQDDRTAAILRYIGK